MEVILMTRRKKNGLFWLHISIRVNFVPSEGMRRRSS